MYQIYMRNAIILQLIATLLYLGFSITLPTHTFPATYLFDFSFGIAAFLVSSLLALWAFRYYR